MNIKLKFQYEEYKERILSIQEINLKITDQLKNLEEKNNNSRYQYNSIKSQAKDKEVEMTNLKNEIKNFKDFKTNKEKHEKVMKNLTSCLNSLKEDLERKSNKLREVQRLNLEFKQKIDNLECKSNNNKKIGESSEAGYSRDLKIKILENENLKLKNDLIKLNDEVIKKADREIANFDRVFTVNNNIDKNLNIDNGNEGKYIL